MRLLQERFWHFLFHTTPAEWEAEFTLMSVWKDGMVQLVGRQHIDFGHSEVIVNILICGVDDDVWMTHRVFSGLVDSRVQGRHVHVFDLFFLRGIDLVM